MLSITLADCVQEYYKSISEGTSDTVINDLLTKIQKDLRQNQTSSKIESIPPLIFFNFLGRDTSWADFDLLDVMSVENSFSAKRISYNAAEIMWTPQSPVVLLAPNRIARDLTSSNQFTASVVLTAINEFMTEQIAVHVMSDVISLMSSMKSVVRQKAITTFYKIFLVYQPALKNGVQSIRQALDDANEGVVLSALDVFCELSSLNPEPFVPLIPKFHHMLCSSYNQWIQIKLIKILKYLCQVEKRLPKKLVQPFMNLLDSTSSHKVLFETIQAVIEIPISNPALVNNATQRVQSFIWSQDPNLRFMSLQMFMKLVRIQPRLVGENKEIVSECLNNDDESIRLSALDLLGSLASKKTIDHVVGRIFEQIGTTKKVSYRDQLVAKIINICSKDDYEMITDFGWYVDVLMDIAEEANISCYGLIAEQFLDMATRVPSAREKIVEKMCIILQDSKYFREDQLLLVAAFVIGEYANSSRPFESILQPMIVNDSERVQACCLSASLKLYLKASDAEKENIETLYSLKLPLFASSSYAEVQERSETLISLLPILKKDDKKAFEEMQQKFARDPDDEEEETVEEIQVPEGLDAPFDIFTSTKEDEDYFNPLKKKGKAKKGKKSKGKGKKKHHQSSKKKMPKSLSEDLLTKNTGSGEDSYDDDEEEEHIEKKRRKGHRKHSKQERDISKSQLLGQNSSLIVRATNFSVSISQPHFVEIELLITNCSRTEFDSIDVQVQETANLRSYEIEPMESLAPGAADYHRIVLESVITNIPQVARVLFIPSSSNGETLEAKIRLLPSLFLVPGDQLLYPTARASLEQNCVGQSEHKCTVKCDVRPRDALQAVAKLLHSTVMKNQDPNSRTLFSKTTSNEDVICTFRIADAVAECTLKAKDSTLATSLTREVEMKLRSLNN